MELISQPKFLQAVVASAFGYAIMTFLMTATPISMHIIDNFSIYSTKYNSDVKPEGWKLEMVKESEPEVKKLEQPLFNRIWNKFKA